MQQPYTDHERERIRRWILHEKYHGVVTDALGADMKRIAAGEPVAYVIGHVSFLGCNIDLSYRPLIPRPETEYWTEQVITHLHSHPHPRCLDMCAGSGCIGVAMLAHVPEAHVDFADIDQNMIKQIHINTKRNRCDPDHYNTVVSNGFERITGRYDVIVCNPPYVASNSTRVTDEVRRWEPAQAVFSGPDGFSFIQQFFNELAQHLNPHGRAYLEFDDGQGARVVEYAETRGYHITLHRDQFDIERVAVITV